MQATIVRNAKDTAHTKAERNILEGVKASYTMLELMKILCSWIYTVSQKKQNTKLQFFWLTVYFMVYSTENIT